LHLAVALFTVFAAWRWGDWRQWKQYHTSMLFIASAGFLYEYLTKDYILWVFHPDFLYNHSVTVIVYAVLTMPLSVLIFLSRYPASSLKKQLFYIAEWVSIYAVFEWILQIAGGISYKNGWNFWHSVLFDLMMFPMLRLHHKKPLMAYGLSLIIIIFLMWYFKVPLK
jgi:hypothetical protein